MADLNSAYPNSIPAAIQKNAGIIALVKVRIRVTVRFRVTLTLTLNLTSNPSPNLTLVKGWRDRFARYDELIAREKPATTTTTCPSPGSPVPRSPAHKERPARRARGGIDSGPARRARGRSVTALALPVLDRLA